MKRPIPLDEQETIISFAPAQVSKVAEVYSCMPNVMKSLRNNAKKHPDSFVILKDEGDAVFASVDRSCIKFSPKRQLTEEQRRAAVERLSKWRSNA